jgi:RimJ/RimL family protein N-acetyltransferase
MPLLQGLLIRLAAINAETDALPWATWSHDSEFLRLLGSDPAKPQLPTQARKELDEAPRPNANMFAIRALADDRLLGAIGYWINHWPSQEAWIGLGLGERDYRGRGYGTDAMRVLLRYLFTELNLHRASLTVFAYNPRAIRSYEKAGFTIEGRLRQTLHRDGQRYDEWVMGVLRSEWLKSEK